MEKSFHFEVNETIAYPLETVWEVITKPYSLNIHNCQNRTQISDTEWIEHTSDTVDNHCEATIDSAERLVSIKGINQKYTSESDDIILALKAIDEQNTQVAIQYTISTSAIFNMLSFKLFGDKIMGFSSSSIFHHMERECKKIL